MMENHPNNEFYTKLLSKFLKKSHRLNIELCFKQKAFNTFENQEKLNEMISQDFDYLVSDFQTQILNWLQVVFKGSSSFSIEEIYFETLMTDYVSVNYTEEGKKYFKQLKANDLFV